MLVQKKLPIIILFLTLTIMCGCESDDTLTANSARELKAAEVTVVEVSEKIAPNQIELVGTVQAVEHAEISSKVSGNIVSISVDPGSKVKKGDILVQLGAGEISARLQQAAAQLQQAQRNLNREEKLLIKNVGTPEAVESLRDTLRISEGAFLESKTMLNYTTITAPFDGIITQKIANTGDLATPGKPLLRIEGENKLQIVTDIPETMVQKITLGDPLKVNIPAANTVVTGVIAEISPTADPSSRTTPIKISIAKEPHLRSGQFARVMFTTEKITTLAIPEASLLFYGQLERVFVVENNRAVLRLVRTGSIIKSEEEADFIEVLSGLNRGDVVITSANSTLQTGQSIKIKPKSCIRKIQKND